MQKDKSAGAYSHQQQPQQYPPQYPPQYQSQYPPQYPPMQQPQQYHQAPPPPYYNQPQQPQQYYPQSAPYQHYPYPSSAASAPPQYSMPSTGTTVVVQGAFDPGARFNGVSQANIPPPPPGCAPNAAQLAASQGHAVVGTQRSDNFFWGETGGGWTW